MEDEYSVRDGAGVKWRMVRHTCMGDQISSGYTIDNLDTKKYEDATSSYERLFILVRETLKANNARCMDNNVDLLHVSQEVSDKVWKSLRKEMRV